MSFKIHFYGHSSLCLEARDEALFFHPNWSAHNLFYKHAVLPLPDEALFAKARAVILSSGSYDHCDLFSFKYFSGRIPMLVPKGLGKWLSHHVANPAVELAAGMKVNHAGFDIGAELTAHGMNALRPFRGCAPLNTLLSWRGKRILGLFHAPTAASLTAWRNQDIDILLLSLGETPVPVFWTELFAPKPNLPADLDTMLGALAHAKTIIPIGWGGFDTSSGKNGKGERGLSLHEQWLTFLQNQSPELRTKVQSIEPGRFFEV